MGLYTNCEGLYLGDPFYDPILAELDRRAATVFVHPVAPVPEVKLKGVSTPAIEYTFETTRTIANLLFSGSRNKYPNVKFIFSHGGGTLPFVASRIVGMASLPFQGGHNPADSMAELKGYYFDLAAVTSAPQLAALNAFVGSSQLVIGSDSKLSPLHTQSRWPSVLLALLGLLLKTRFSPLLPRCVLTRRSIGSELICRVFGGRPEKDSP